MTVDFRTTVDSFDSFLSRFSRSIFGQKEGEVSLLAERVRQRVIKSRYLHTFRFLLELCRQLFSASIREQLTYRKLRPVICHRSLSPFKQNVLAPSIARTISPPCAIFRPVRKIGKYLPRGRSKSALSKAGFYNGDD